MMSVRPRTPALTRATIVLGAAISVLSTGGAIGIASATPASAAVIAPDSRPGATHDGTRGAAPAAADPNAPIAPGDNGAAAQALPLDPALGSAPSNRAGLAQLAAAATAKATSTLAPTPPVAAAPTLIAMAASQRAFITAMVPGAQDAQRRYGVPASVTIAQAILESAWGKSSLSAKQNNYFGIKCTSDNGPFATGCVTYPTRECGASGCWTQNASFRVYATAAGSLADHGRFLKVNSRYAPAFRTTTSDDFVRAVAKAGYATDPRYATSLIDLMSTYGLRAYDLPR